MLTAPALTGGGTSGDDGLALYRSFFAFLLQAPGTPVRSEYVDNKTGETTVVLQLFAAGIVGGGCNTPIDDFQVSASGGEIDMSWTEGDATFTLKLRSVSQP